MQVARDDLSCLGKCHEVGVGRAGEDKRIAEGAEKFAGHGQRSRYFRVLKAIFLARLLRRIRKARADTACFAAHTVLVELFS